MITFITGMPGDGKSLFAVSLLVKDLVERECFVVTNIKMRAGRLHEYVSKLREKAGRKEPWDLDKRFKQISDGEAFEFFRYRSGDLKLSSSPDVLARNNETERLTKREHDEQMLEVFKPMKEGPEFKVPVHYYIDEVHEIFPSREWANGGRGVLYYTSKHRHLHDEIFLITQQIPQVEKQLRDLSSETAVCRNHARRSVGAFKAKPIIKVKLFYGLPGPTSKPFSDAELSLDPAEVASCYQTAGALGVHDAPEAVKNKGWLPWWVLYVAGGLGAIGLSVLVFGMPFLSSLIGSKVGEASAGIADKAGAAAPPRQTLAQGSVAERPLGGSTPPQQVPTLAKEVFVRHVVATRNPDRITVQLSDGRAFDESSGQRIEILRTGVKVGAKFYRTGPVGPGREEKPPAAVPEPMGPSGTIEADPAPGDAPKRKA